MKRQFGLSLVELLISIALGLFLMVGVIQMFLSTKNSHATQQGLSRIQETGRMVVEFLGRDLRMASAVGCVRIKSPGKTDFNVVDSGVNKGGLHKDFLVGLRGYKSPSALASSVALKDALGSMVPDPDSDILVIRGATERGFPIAAKNTSKSVFAYTPAKAIVDNCLEDLCVGDVAVVSDCDSGRIFPVVSMSLSGNQLTIAHNEDWDLSISQLNVYDKRPEVFIYPLHTVVYFIAPGASGEPSLWQRMDRDGALELIEGIEHIQFTYQIEGINNFVRADAVSTAQWQDVVAVRTEFVVRGAEANALDSVQKYMFAGKEITPTDKRIRQVFSATYAIRTRDNQL